MLIVFLLNGRALNQKKDLLMKKEIEHYRQVLIALKERNIEPFVTLYHWTLPKLVS